MTTVTVSAARPRHDAGDAAVLSIRHLRKHFPIREGLLQRVTGHVRAVDDVSFDVKPGETVGVVGESGCGKTTLGRCIAGLMDPTDGGIYFDLTGPQRRRLDELLAVEGRGEAQEQELAQLVREHRIDALDKPHWEHYRQNCQVVFQDAFASLNPRQLVRDIVGRPLRIHRGMSGAALTERVAELLDDVGLARTHLFRYPHQFSGGQRQRISIARALALEPRLIILDEPTSALDVSVQAQILNLLHRLQDEYGLTYLFISHDLNVVRHMSDRIIVMYLGQICEYGEAQTLFDDPRHPYTEALLAANPSLQDTDSPRMRLRGTVPSPAAPPSGCRFHTRCPKVTEACGWDVDDIVARLRTRGAPDVVEVEKASAFVGGLSFESEEHAERAVRELRSSETPRTLANALRDVRVSGRVVHVALEPVDEMTLEDLGDGRATACLLHTRENPPPSLDLP